MKNPFLSPEDPASRLQEPDQTEVATGFHPDVLPVFLWKLVPLIQEDFGPAQVHQLIETSDALKLSEAKKIHYRVSFRGRRLEFRIILFRYEMNAVGFYLKAPWSLANEVQKTLDEFLSMKPAKG